MQDSLLTRPSNPTVRTPQARRAGRDGTGRGARTGRSGMGAVILAVPFALCVTAVLVVTGGLSLLWAVPVYGLTGAAATGLLIAFG